VKIKMDFETKFKRDKLNSRLSNELYKVLKGIKKNSEFIELFDFTIDELRQHLEGRFKKGMSWENYGKWHLDHIIPKSLWEFTSPKDKEFKQCWALTNLQPLWALENIKKNNRI
jgi:hypothetical protein